jgi:hypothetical protein
VRAKRARKFGESGVSEASILGIWCGCERSESEVLGNLVLAECFEASIGTLVASEASQTKCRLQARDFDYLRPVIEALT